MKALLLLALAVLCLSAPDLNSQIPTDQRIVEVYGDHLEPIRQADPQRFADIEKMLSLRFEIRKLKMEAGEKFPRLSQVPLFNKYNPSLQRDAAFDPTNFNPLKYDLEFFAPTDKVYRVDGSDYILFIKGQKNNL